MLGKMEVAAKDIEPLLSLHQTWLSLQSPPQIPISSIKHDNRRETKKQVQECLSRTYSSYYLVERNDKSEHITRLDNVVRIIIV